MYSHLLSITVKELVYILTEGGGSILLVKSDEKTENYFFAFLANKMAALQGYY